MFHNKRGNKFSLLQLNDNNKYDIAGYEIPHVARIRFLNCKSKFSGKYVHRAIHSHADVPIREIGLQDRSPATKLSIQSSTSTCSTTCNLQNTRR